MSITGRNDTLDDLVARAAGALDALHTASESLASIVVSCTSDDGVVTVEVGGTGAMTDLLLASDLTGIDASRLGATIVDVTGRAAREALEYRHTILAQMEKSVGGG